MRVAKLTRKPAPGSAGAGRAVPAPGAGIGRRGFLAAGGAASAALALAPALMRRSRAAQSPEISPKQGLPTELRHTVCAFCSVGCGIVAEVQNGVWTGQEPDFDSPINFGAHCAKGAASRDVGRGEKRIKYPLKLRDGRWKRLSWDQAIDEIGDRLLAIREQSGPDALFFCGSSKASNEGAYLQRKFAAFWGSNNCDHQARICHSTTVAGVANTFGYGAMTNPYNDMHNCKSMLFIGSNAAEAHPVAMQHVLKGKERGAKLIVVDPRFTRTAVHAHQYVRLRPGSDVAFIWGVLWHVLKHGWEDRSVLRDQVYGFDAVREEVARWTPDHVERVTGVAPGDVERVARTMAENRPGTLVWCMGGTQHHTGSSNTRAYCILQLALGNIGKAGGGTNIFRGHDNVQGATDVGPNAHTLPGYYGLSEDAWKHWARVWDVDLDWLRGRFDFSRRYPTGVYDADSGGRTGVPGDDAQAGGRRGAAGAAGLSYRWQYPMHMPGIPVSRWYDAVLERADNVQQRAPIRAAIFQGHAVNSQTRNVELKKALEVLELLVISDMFPTHAAVLGERRDGVYLLPAASQYETHGSVTSSNRSIQWRERVIEPLFEALPDHVMLYRLARKLGFAAQMFKHIAVEDGVPSIEDALREINRGAWSIGYSGQSPERLQQHARRRGDFDKTTLRADSGPLAGEYYGLPWPCWGTPAQRHPGTPILYDTGKPVAEGGLTLRARWGVEHEGENLLAENVWSVGSDIEDGYPEFTDALLRQLGWWNELTADERAAADGRNWKTDLSGGIQRVAIAHGCAPFGNGKARVRVWTFPDPVPRHREPLYSARRDLVAAYPTYPDRKTSWRLPTRYASVQARDHSRDYPLVHTSGRLVEFEGGGAETRSNRWLAEQVREMFVEINPADADRYGIDDGIWVWLEGPDSGRIRVRAKVIERVPAGLVFTPFHFGGWFQGKDLLARYPADTAPYVRGEACNTATTYGYDIVTQMQESKVTLCRLWPA